MLEVFQLTMQKVSTLLVFIAAGYFLRKAKGLPEETGRVLSQLTTKLFLPCYVINRLSATFTVDVLGQKMLLLGCGLLFVIVSFAVAFVLAKIFARTPLEKKSLLYAFSIPNTGYFGYPVIDGVFGSAVLADAMVFMAPMNLVTYTFGYMLFVNEGKFPWKRLFTPMAMGVYIGIALGLSGITLPSFISSTISGAGACMSPCSMLLAGFMLGRFPLKKLLSGVRPYYLSAIRLLGIPLVFGIVLVLCGVKGLYILLPLVMVSMPLGLNLVVYPESLGHEQEASNNAKLCFVSYLLALVILPFSFALISHISG